MKEKIKKDWKKEIGKLKKNQQDTDKRIGRIIDMLNVQMELSKINFNCLKNEIKFWEKILKLSPLLFLLILISVSLDVILEITTWGLASIIKAWDSFSENWQIAIFWAFWTLFCVILGAIINRKFFQKSIKTNSSKKTNNAKKNKF